MRKRYEVSGDLVCYTRVPWVYVLVLRTQLSSIRNFESLAEANTKAGEVPFARKYRSKRSGGFRPLTAISKGMKTCLCLWKVWLPRKGKPASYRGVVGWVVVVQMSLTNLGSST